MYWSPVAKCKKYFWAIWANFHCCKLAWYWKNILTIWSHYKQLLDAPYEKIFVSDVASFLDFSNKNESLTDDWRERLTRFVEQKIYSFSTEGSRLVTDRRDRLLFVMTGACQFSPVWKKNLGSFHSGIRHLLWKHVRVRENRTSYEDGDDDGPFCLSVDDSLKRKWGLKTISVTRFGNFWKFLVTNHLSKVAQMFGDFCDILKTSLFE